MDWKEAARYYRHKWLVARLCINGGENAMDQGEAYLWKQRAQVAADTIKEMEINAAAIYERDLRMAQMLDRQNERVKELERLNELLREELQATRTQLYTENERLRRALIHRCTVQHVDDACPDCQEIVTLLDLA